MSDNAVSSHSRDSGVARLWRGWVVAVLAILLASGGHQAAHSLMHGSADSIPWELLGFSAAMTAPIAVALAGKRISVVSTGLTTIFGQVAFHTLYSLPSTGGALHHTQHASHVAESTAAAGAAMLFAHLLAAVVTTFVIVDGERSLVTIVAWLLLVPVHLVLGAAPNSTARPKPIPTMGARWIPHPMNVAQTRWTRGPPVLA